MPTSTMSISPQKDGPSPRSMPVFGAPKVTVRFATNTLEFTEPSRALTPLGMSTARTGTSKTNGGVHEP